MAGGGGSIYDDEDSGGGMINEINVTPLVDIVLVLLIIFMVTAKLIVNRAIPGVETPKATTGEEVRTTLALTIDRDRRLYLNGDAVADKKAISDYLRGAVASNPDIQAVITADGNVPYADFVGLVDLIREAGVKKYALTVGDKPKETP
jgi:biopolymer transport protein ExbD